MQKDKRTADGKFAPGNGGGPGNPYARETARRRRILAELVTDDDLREIMKALIKNAKEGHLASAQEVINRTVGKPVEVVNPDTVDIEELDQKNQRERASMKADISFGIDSEALKRIMRELNTPSEDETDIG